jgi:hypothetical protein
MLQGEAESERIEESQEEVQLRRSSRQPQPSTRLRDYVTYSVNYPIQDYISYKNISNEHYVFLTALSKIKEPTNYEVAKMTQNVAKPWKKSFML